MKKPLLAILALVASTGCGHPPAPGFAGRPPDAALLAAAKRKPSLPEAPVEAVRTALGRLARAFHAAADQDGDEMVDREEWAAAAGASRRGRFMITLNLNLLYADVAEDGRGVGIEALTEAIRSPARVRTYREDTAGEFARCDADANRTLDRQELAPLTARLPFKPGFVDLDRDGDGRIDLAEFQVGMLAAMTSNMGATRPE